MARDEVGWGMVLSGILLHDLCTDLDSISISLRTTNTDLKVLTCCAQRGLTRCHADLQPSEFMAMWPSRDGSSSNC